MKRGELNLHFRDICVGKHLGEKLLIALMMMTYKPGYLPDRMVVCLPACMHARVHACVPCMHACMHAFLHAFMHAYMHVYTHTCIYTCMHACIRICCRDTGKQANIIPNIENNEKVLLYIFERHLMLFVLCDR